MLAVQHISHVMVWIFFMNMSSRTKSSQLHAVKCFNFI